MNQPLNTASLALRAAQVASRFERICRRQVINCRVKARVATDGQQIELQVGAGGGDRSKSLSVSGLDRDSWADVAGMESLARVVNVWMEAPESDAGVRARQGARREPVRRLVDRSLVDRSQTVAAARLRPTPAAPATLQSTGGRAG